LIDPKKIYRDAKRYGTVDTLIEDGNIRDLAAKALVLHLKYV
jgi:hypothetical protein